MTPTIEIDSLVQDHWSETERSNAELVHRFVQLVMNEHNFNAVLEQFERGLYVQHNRTMPDGIAGVVATVKGYVKRYPGFSYDVKNIVSSGDLVMFHSHATFRESDRGDESKGMIIFDMWRIEEGVIAEHWDSLQGLDMSSRLLLALAGGRVRNSNGIF